MNEAFGRPLVRERERQAWQDYKAACGRRCSESRSGRCDPPPTPEIRRLGRIWLDLYREREAETKKGPVRRPD